MSPPQQRSDLILSVAALATSTLLVLSLLVPPSSGYVFSSQCDTISAYSPENATGPPLCPACCKVPVNLTFTGAPAKVYKNSGNADKCILLCADYAFYAVDSDYTCRCYDHCDEKEQMAAAGESPVFVALGNVTACLSACFPQQQASETVNRCECPEHSMCIPGPIGDPKFRCCCKSTYNFPTILPDNSSVCMAFQLGANLAGVTVVTPDTDPSVMTSV